MGLFSSDGCNMAVGQYQVTGTDYTSQDPNVHDSQGVKVQKAREVHSRTADASDKDRMKPVIQ